jgi:hypothetical protein
MRRNIFTLLILVFILASCKKEESTNATVLGKGIDCGDAYLLKLKEGVSGLPENNIDNTFYEINLPEEYKVEGKKVNIEFREPENEEIMLCTTAGPGYAQIYITEVK